MSDTQQPASITDEDAYSFIVQRLTEAGRTSDTSEYDTYIPSILTAYIATHYKGTAPPRQYELEAQLSPQFMSAAWELCRRGVLRPGPRAYKPTGHDGSVGIGFCVTGLGRNWIKRAQQFDYAFIEPGRFAGLLAGFDRRYGPAYASRSQEAIRCYGSLAHIACCAMCGAGAESVLLALATAKDGNEDEVVKKYMSSRGRTVIENMIIGQQPDPVKNEVQGYLTLLKYWRDAAAHGKVEGLTETEAYTSLTTLLRFAQYADERWAELTL